MTEPRSSERIMSMTCRVCGETISTTSDRGAVQMLADLEAAHDLLQPACSTVKPARVSDPSVGETA